MSRIVVAGNKKKMPSLYAVTLENELSVQAIIYSELCK